MNPSLVLHDTLAADKGLGGERFQSKEREVFGEWLRVAPTLFHLPQAAGGDALELAASVDEGHVGCPAGLIPEEVLDLSSVPAAEE